MVSSVLKAHVLKNELHTVRQTQTLKADVLENEMHRQTQNAKGSCFEKRNPHNPTNSNAKGWFFWQIKCVGPEQIKGFDQVGDKGLRLTLNNTHARHCWSAPLDALRMPS